ncbi:hypothetical protein ACFYZT_12055 [Streptomyces sp. NPDC001591]|uniref:hypothetical protein n=1 Tax=Streptomyces sp. NPDC001591 TaxID=3364589 RepID=UPI0036923015
MFTDFPTTDDYRPAIEEARCIRCAGVIRWIACPTGGWWAHDTHPADHHDAAPDQEQHLTDHTRH